MHPLREQAKRCRHATNLERKTKPHMHVPELSKFIRLRNEQDEMRKRYRENSKWWNRTISQPPPIRPSDHSTIRPFDHMTWPFKMPSPNPLRKGKEDARNNARNHEIERGKMNLKKNTSQNSVSHAPQSPTEIDTALASKPPCGWSLMKVSMPNDCGSILSEPGTGKKR